MVPCRLVPPQPRRRLHPQAVLPPPPLFRDAHPQGPHAADDNIEAVMPTSVRPAVLWMPNVELFMLLANLTEEGQRFQPKAVNPLRRAAWLRFDDYRRAPAVVETGRLPRDAFW